ncbi:MAG: hypothetical protein U5K69_23465 [Balneolaceae bacterium]|nr:hypothetical protein [Balneolaceae bacterium]
MVAGKDRARVLTDQLSPKEQLNYMHTFSSQSTNVTEIRGEIMKGISRLCYRMRGYRMRARSYFGYLRIQHREHKGTQRSASAPMAIPTWTATSITNACKRPSRGSATCWTRDMHCVGLAWAR